MLNCIRMEMKKLCYLPFFLFSVLCVACLCMASTVSDPVSGKMIPVFSLLFSGDPQERAGYDALELWSDGFGGWGGVMLPMLLTFGYIVLISEERKNGQIRFLLLRAGNGRYCISKVVSGALTGGIIAMSGYALYGAAAAAAFPVSGDLPWLWETLASGGGIPLFVILRLAGAFLYGAAVSIYGIGVSVFFRDKYMLLCLPFLMNYLYMQIVQKLTMDAAAAGDERRLARLELFSPTGIMDLYPGSRFYLSAGMVLALYVCLTAVFYLYLKRRDGNA